MKHYTRRTPDKYTALILNIDTVLRCYQAIASVTYYTQPERKPEDA